VTCGFPSKKALAKKGRRIGECWSPATSLDHHTEIMITMLEDDPLLVLSILAHELVHAAVGVKEGHRHPFIALARQVGLVAPWASASASDALKTGLATMAKRLGPYPHARMAPLVTTPAQTTRLKKVHCPDCGYTIRVTAKWMVRGLPVCPCGREMTQVEV